MITRVLDERGRIVHDCAEAGCSVSWDGYALNDNAVAPEHVDDNGRDVPEAKVKKGDRMPNGQDPDPNKYVVSGQTARLRSSNG